MPTTPGLLQETLNADFVDGKHASDLGGGSDMVRSLYRRVTLAEINAGLILLAVPADKAFRLVDLILKPSFPDGPTGDSTPIHVALHCGTATLVNIAEGLFVGLASVDLDYLIAAGGTGSTALAAQAAGDDVHVSKSSGETIAVPDYIDFILTYVLEDA
jgi:hypothetical protein